MPLWVEDWQWDENNRAELARHGITRKIVEQVHREKPRFRRNTKNRAATDKMIGPDRGGTFWVICILRVPSQPGLWRAITGWRARDWEKKWHRRSR